MQKCFYRKDHGHIFAVAYAVKMKIKHLLFPKGYLSIVYIYKESIILQV